MRSTRKTVNAFTLVELLVVIGIIAVLIGILLPALGRARSQAKSVACQANLRQIGQAINIYAVNNKGVLPIGDWDGVIYTDRLPSSVVTSVGAADRATRWPLLLMSVLSTKYGASFNDSSRSGGDIAGLRKIFQCPEAPEGNVTMQGQSSGGLCYQGHPYLMPGINWGSGNADQFPTTPPSLSRPYKIAKIKRSTEIALVFDCPLVYESVTINGQSMNLWHPRYEAATAGWIDNGARWRPPYMWDDFNSTTANPNDSVDMTVLNFAPNQKVNQDVLQNAMNIRFRHLKDTVANALMVDGHVESFTYNPRKSSNDKTVTTFKRKNLFVNRP